MSVEQRSFIFTLSVTPQMMSAMSTCTTERADLGSCLARWAGRDTMRLAMVRTVEAIAEAGASVGAALRHQLIDDHAAVVGYNCDGDPQRSIDVMAHDTLVRALSTAPVAAVASEETAGITILRSEAPLVVALDPLDGSANLEVNGAAGVIFSIRPAPTNGPIDEACFLTAGKDQLGAGMIVFGPATVLVITVGAGTDIYFLDDESRCFRRVQHGVSTPTGTREFAVNASNVRHWSPAVRAYVADLTVGIDGPRGADFNMRWLGALVADAYRILLRGGVFLYPADARAGYEAGRLRLVYEAQPIAMLFEQAHGAATDGSRRILELTAPHLHARTPLVFGSADKVARVSRYGDMPPSSRTPAPLFGTRGLFRDEG
jgi:fructose-1,6-bisphosphatase I